MPLAGLRSACHVLSTSLALCMPAWRNFAAVRFQRVLFRHPAEDYEFTMCVRGIGKVQSSVAHTSLVKAIDFSGSVRGLWHTVSHC